MARADRFDIFVVVEPWQLLLFDADSLVDAVFGELGATGLTLRIKADSVREVFTIDAEGRPAALRIASGAFFHPAAERYASTRLRPQVSPSLRARDPAARLAEICRDRALKFRLRFSALRDAAMVSRHPEHACRNALSLASTTHLCPANADVAEMVRCSLLDLAEQFQPDLIELENYTWADRYTAGGTQPAWPLEPGPVEATLLASCFCPSCQQRAVQAGIEPAAAMRSVQVHLRRWLHEESIAERPLSDLLRDSWRASGRASFILQGLGSPARPLLRPRPARAIRSSWRRPSTSPQSRLQTDQRSSAVLPTWLMLP